MHPPKSYTRRDFLGHSGSCAAHIGIMAAASPMWSRLKWGSQERFPVDASEPWGRLERISEGIWALVSTPLEDRTTLCNGGIVAGRAGVVVNLLDNKMFALNPDFFSYTIAKYGLLGATKVLAMELAPRVRVCAIAPGITLPSTNQSQARFRKAHALNPMGKGATLEQLVAALRFILSAPALTGEVITIDGGQSLQGMPRDVSFLAED